MRAGRRQQLPAGIEERRHQIHPARAGRELQADGLCAAGRFGAEIPLHDVMTAPTVSGIITLWQ
jgi:hypothetical protein